MKANRRPGLRVLVLVTSMLLLIGGAASGAHASTVLQYDDCYEVSIAILRPRALIDPTLPEGFTATPFAPDPTGTMGSYGLIGYQCSMGGTTVAEVLYMVAVRPPAGLAGNGANFLLLQGVTTDGVSAAAYRSWCLDAMEMGDVSFRRETTPAARLASFEARHSLGLLAATETVVPEPSTLSDPGGTLRILDVNETSIGIADLDYTASIASGPLSGLVSINGSAPEAAPVLHIYGSSEAPNDWQFHGGCS